MVFVVILFWSCCLLLTYVYVLYPVLVTALAARYGRPVHRGDALPTVTIIVTVYNEEKCIRAKLDNLAGLELSAGAGRRHCCIRRVFGLNGGNCLKL